jgi:DNA ligase-1
MRFADLAAAYERLEETSRKLEVRDILVDLLKKVDHKTELAPLVYLMQGQLRPEYEGVQLGVADSLARRAVVEATHASDAKVGDSLRRTGDLGTTVAEILPPRAARLSAEPLALRDVYDALMTIARASGSGSQNTKIQALVELLARSTAIEGKYVIRFVLGKLRLGVREMTLLDAFNALYASGSKADRVRMEEAFNRSSDLGVVAERLATGGLEALDTIEIEVGRPVRAMLAERTTSLDDLLERMDGRAALEYKYDGLRVQAHVPAKGKVRLFSRRLEEISTQFPELVDELPAALRHKPAIVEGECVPVDAQTGDILPFQEVSRRRGRKHDLDRIREEVPIRLYLFDDLLDGGKPQIDHALPARRKALEALVRETDRVRVADQRVVTTVEEAERYFLEAIAGGCEGIMAKSLADGSTYRAGARGYWWIKYKRDYGKALGDSIDSVVVGAFYGRGRRGGLYGALLCAVYNPDEDRFESFTKVGSGFDDATLAELPRRLGPYEVKSRPDSVVTGLQADVWFKPMVVIEIRGAELTLSPVHRAAQGAVREDAGLALRFPRFTGRFREDKAPDEATTVAELLAMYRQQVRQMSRSAEAVAARA